MFSSYLTKDIIVKFIFNDKLHNKHCYECNDMSIMILLSEVIGQI